MLAMKTSYIVLGFQCSVSVKTLRQKLICYQSDWNVEKLGKTTFAFRIKTAREKRECAITQCNNLGSLVFRDTRREGRGEKPVNYNQKIYCVLLLWLRFSYFQKQFATLWTIHINTERNKLLAKNQQKAEQIYFLTNQVGDYWRE